MKEREKKIDATTGSKKKSKGKRKPRKTKRRCMDIKHRNDI